MIAFSSPSLSHFSKFTPADSLEVQADTATWKAAWQGWMVWVVEVCVVLQSARICCCECFNFKFAQHLSRPALLLLHIFNHPQHTDELASWWHDIVMLMYIAEKYGNEMLYEMYVVIPRWEMPRKSWIVAVSPLNLSPWPVCEEQLWDACKDVVVVVVVVRNHSKSLIMASSFRLVISCDFISTSSQRKEITAKMQRYAAGTWTMDLKSSTVGPVFSLWPPPVHRPIRYELELGPSEAGNRQLAQCGLVEWHNSKKGMCRGIQVFSCRMLQVGDISTSSMFIHDSRSPLANLGCMLDPFCLTMKCFGSFASIKLCLFL